MKSPRSLRFFLDHCRHAQRRQGVVYTLNLFQLFNQSPASKYSPHLSLAQPNSLSRPHCYQVSYRWKYKSSTDNCELINKIGAVWRFFYGRMISFLLTSLIVIFLGVLLTCYSLLEPPLLPFKQQNIGIMI